MQKSNLRFMMTLFAVCGGGMALAGQQHTIRTMRIPDSDKRTQDTKSTDKPDPVMLQLKAKLSKVLKQDCPEASIAINEDGLSAQYHARKFLVYNIAMTGAISPKPTETIGPDYDGFYLTVTTHEDPLIEQATSQVLKEPYWSTYFRNYELKNQHRYLHLSLSYGSRTASKQQAMLERIKAAAASVE